MNVQRTVAIVLAARGSGASWGTVRYSVPFCGASAPARVARALRQAGLEEIAMVVDVEATASSLPGAAPEVRCVASREESRLRLASFIEGARVVAACADLPLLTPSTVEALLQAFGEGRSSCLVADGGALAVCHGDRTAVDFLCEALDRFDDRPLSRGEDGTWHPADPDDVRRLTAAADYSPVERAARGRRLAALSSSGVVILDADRTYADERVRVGEGTTILPGTHLVGETVVGRACSVGPDAWIEDSTIEDAVTVRYSVIESARVRERSSIGPFTHLRPGADVGPEARVGNFVEVKAARLGRGVKAGHLAYIGDAKVGAGTNVGAGTITCNYDGRAKHETVIEDDVFVGSNVSLVAPVTIGRGAVLGAGSTITEDVPPGTLALARARQVLKELRSASPEEGS